MASLASYVITSDNTRYQMFSDGSRRRDPAKPYRNKAERKRWKKNRMRAAGLL